MRFAWAEGYLITRPRFPGPIFFQGKLLGSIKQGWGAILQRGI